MPRKSDSKLAALPPIADGDHVAGRDYWRSLDELAQTEEFLDAMRHEFPAKADTWTDDASRRSFLKLMGASLSLAGLSGCFQQPQEKIVPYVDPPEEVIPGKPLYYASAFTMGGRATRILVESHSGRPTKIEGNPVDVSEPQTESRPDAIVQHGPTDLFAQADLLTMYDPDRSQTPLYKGQIRPWRVFRDELNQMLAAKGENVKLRLLTQTITSPTLLSLMDEVLEKYPEAKWHRWEPINRDNSHAGAELAFGEVVEPTYSLENAKTILSLDSDFLLSMPETLSLIGQFASARVNAVESADANAMSRFYMVDGAVSSTGAKADVRLPLRPSLIPALAAEIAAALEIDGAKSVEKDWDEETVKFVKAVTADLKQASENGVVLVGETQPPAVHALAAMINEKLGAVGKTVSYHKPLEGDEPSHLESLTELVDAMNGEEVDLLLIVGGNPVYDAPADLQFADALEKVPFRAHISLFDDETSVRCQWHLATSHTLESWGDTRGADGTVSLVQPLIAPLYESKSEIEVLAILAGRGAEKPNEIVKQYWAKEKGLSGKELDDFWMTALHNGFVPETGFETVDVSAGGNAAKAIETIQEFNGRSRRELELTLRPDPSIWDGRFANNGWLQEVPKPLTKLTWDNAALVSPATAEEQGWSTGDLLTLTIDGGESADGTGVSVPAPVLVVPGHAPETISLALGFGRTRAGRVGNKVGFDAYPLRTTNRMWMRGDIQPVKTDETYPLAVTQHHHLMDGRHLVYHGTIGDYAEHPEHPHFMESGHEAPGIDDSFYPARPYEGYKWGMSINTTACVGCNACLVACQSENNVPVVGKEEVLRGREMHWLRIDTYYIGDKANPETAVQPVACQHCELAPCEVVCPVTATSHSPEGINEMTYNRCVGTRYCSNNCPYKVRRFNFLEYTKYGELPTLQMAQNPDVTVRNRGVMEKCTYCVQRVNHATLQAEVRDDRVTDAHLKTACQAVCPAGAIVFGDLNDEDAALNKVHEGPLTFGLLEETNTRPRTRYIASITNPHPDLKKHADHGEHS